MIASATAISANGGRHQVKVPEAGERDGHDLGRQDEVGADRALDLQLLELGGIGHGVDQLLLMLVVVEQDFSSDLLGRFEGQIGAADHQQRRDQERREGGQQERRGQQEQRSCS